MDFGSLITLSSQSASGTEKVRSSNWPSTDQQKNKNCIMHKKVSAHKPKNTIDKSGLLKQTSSRVFKDNLAVVQYAACTTSSKQGRGSVIRQDSAKTSGQPSRVRQIPRDSRRFYNTCKKALLRKFASYSSNPALLALRRAWT